MARRGQLMFTMTPLLGLSWTYDELWESEDPSVFKVKWSLLDNPHIADEDVRGEIARMQTDAVYKARIDGNFAHNRLRSLRRQFPHIQFLVSIHSEKLCPPAHPSTPAHSPLPTASAR